MAIKGKRRTRGGRGVAAPPRPHLVAPRKPFLARTGVRVALLVVLAGLVGAGVLSGLAAQRRADRLQFEREETAKFGTFLENEIQSKALGQSFLTSYLILPELGQAVAEFNQGSLRPRRLARDAEQWEERARAAAERIGELEPELASLREARNLIQRSLLMYAGLARLAGIAGGADEETRAELFAVLEEQLPVAAEVFDSGWRELTNQRDAVGLLVSQPAAPNPLLPDQP